jgi:hypothetical protein
VTWKTTAQITMTPPTIVAAGGRSMPASHTHKGPRTFSSWVIRAASAAGMSRAPSELLQDSGQGPDERGQRDVGRAERAGTASCCFVATGSSGFALVLEEHRDIRDGGRPVEPGVETSEVVAGLDQLALSTGGLQATAAAQSLSTARICSCADMP